MCLLIGSCGGDGAVAVDAEPEADADGCHELANSADEVVQVRVAEAAPVATGGTVPDGLYHLIQDRIYTGVGGATGETGYTSTMSSDCVSLDCRIAIVETGGTMPLQRFTLTLDDTAMTLAQTCPGDGMVDATFTGDGTTVTIYETILVGVRERIYELQ